MTDLIAVDCTDDAFLDDLGKRNHIEGKWFAPQRFAPMEANELLSVFIFENGGLVGDGVQIKIK